MNDEHVNVIAIITGNLLKGVTFGILPFLLFVLITSRTSIISGIRSFVVLTGSMEPILPVGTIVFTSQSPVYQVSDIVAYQAQNSTVTHRIIDVVVKGNVVFYKTQGDANNTPDTDLVIQSQILGKAFFSFPYLGKLIIFLRSVTGYLILIVLPAIVFIIFEFLNIKNEVEKEVQKKFIKKMSAI